MSPDPPRTQEYTRGDRVFTCIADPNRSGELLLLRGTVFGPTMEYDYPYPGSDLPLYEVYWDGWHESECYMAADLLPLAPDEARQSLFLRFMWHLERREVFPQPEPRFNQTTKPGPNSGVTSPGVPTL